MFRPRLKFLCISFLLTASCNIDAQTGQGKTAKADTVFFDDFSGKTLDRTKWNVEITGNTYNNEQQAYVDSLTTLFFSSDNETMGAHKGALIIQGLYKPGFVSKQGKTYDFLSARINTRGKVEFVNGTAAARIKLTAGPGLWPAFWALGTGRWPDTGEIDIMEYVGEPDWTSVALHGPGYSGNTPLVSKAFFSSPTDVTAWHIYSVDWTSDGFIFKLDGKVTYTVTRAMIERYGAWAYDNPKFLILNLALGGGYPAGVNKVTTPYNGIPQSTVDIIKKGEAKLIVDWVVITK
jgi:beta-glucanase (GH16 family)